MQCCYLIFSFIASLQQIEFSQFHLSYRKYDNYFLLILICKYFYTWYTNVYDLLHNDSTIGTNLWQKSFLLLLRRKGIRLILKFERVKLLPEKTQWPAYFHHSPDRKMTRSIIDEDFKNKKTLLFLSTWALNVEFSDGSVNSYSRKIHAQIQKQV